MNIMVKDLIFDISNLFHSSLWNVSSNIRMVNNTYSLLYTHKDKKYVLREGNKGCIIILKI